MPDINRSAYGPQQDMTFAQFQAELVNTPIAAQADLAALYALLYNARRPDGQFLLLSFSLGMNYSENQYATVIASIEARYHTHNWGMRRSPAAPQFRPGGADNTQASIIGTNRGSFVSYDSWPLGVIDYIYALTSPKFVYQQEDRQTVAEINARWAPAGDQDNDPVAKSRTVATIMDRLSQPLGEAPMTPPTIAISAGHHNKQGGNAFEIEQTGLLARAVGEACEALGMRVVHLTPDKGMGTSSLSLDTVAAGVNNLSPHPAIYIETHTEGDGGTGVFAIYPDWTNDLDAEVRDKLGPDLARRVAAATGLGLGAGGDGVMSEKQTGVGAAGSRLGVFRATEPSKNTTTRLIVEYGAHDKEPDLTIVKRPIFYQKAAVATAEAFANFLGWEATTPPGPATDPVSAALVNWYRSKDTQLQGDLGNNTFYEVNIDWTGIYPQLPANARGIRGQYFGGWYNPTTKAVDPIFLDDFATLRTFGKMTPRK